MISIRFESRRAAEAFVSQAENLGETYSADDDPTAAGYARLIDEIARQLPDPPDVDACTVTMPKYHNISRSPWVSVDVEGVATDVRDRCLDGCTIGSGQVTIEAHDEVTLDEKTAEALEVVLETFTDVPGIPAELERALNTLNDILDNR